MNQRLIELYRSVRPVEALKSQDIYESANVLIGSEVEKFAELFVRECAAVGSRFSMAHPEDIRYQIKRHFGVEL